MPPSQLKQLKTSLREHGFVGPQKSKKQKKAIPKDAGKKLQHNAALEGIRNPFNPFEVKAPTRKEKFEVTSNKVVKSGPGRPGVTKGLGEEKRKVTLLKEIHRRNKVGGIHDRRFGENDPTMTPEQRAAERFARQNERMAKKSSMFNLEEDEEEDMALTHAGKILEFDSQELHDDFEEDGVDELEEGFHGNEIDNRPRKRMRLDDEKDDQDDQLNGELNGSGTDENTIRKKKTKNEVMEEIIKKSKLHKYERQLAKEDDDELRAELDAGMHEFYEAVNEQKIPPKPTPTSTNSVSDPHMNPDRAAMLAGKDRQVAEKEYNERLRQMAMDARSKPSDRTKTEEEKAAEEAEKLQELERKRLQRMKGLPDNSEDENDPDNHMDDDEEEDDAEVFGLAHPDSLSIRRELDVEDEDEFVLDDDIIASDPDAEASGDFPEESDEDLIEDDGDDDFINGLVLPTNNENGKDPGMAISSQPRNNLAFTYPCPQTHKELLEVVADTTLTDLPIVVQRIRALYHPGLAEGNKAKLVGFAAALTTHIRYLVDQDEPPNMAVIENLLRHLHSMAKSQPAAIGPAFRIHLQEISTNRPLNLTQGDLILLTGISVVFPTSDHFHSVVTPAQLIIARYLGQSLIQSVQDLITGLYCCTLALQYQHLSSRFVPELITYAVTALAILAPVTIPNDIINSTDWTVPRRTLFRCPTKSANDVRRVRVEDLYESSPGRDSLPLNLLNSFVELLVYAAYLWQPKSAFSEIFSPPVLALRHIISSQSEKSIPAFVLDKWRIAFSTIQTLREEALQKRKPLLLHNHRPLAIKQSIPKFEEGFNPDRHYDPDRERSELNKLKAEHKREKKGAMRELRKDANFIARETLREKKEKDAAYDKKFKRLVAEIQGEEGHESKQYEKEKAKRQGKW